MNILWDFDGTLFDTYPAYAKHFNEVLNDERIDKDEVFRQLKISISHACSYYNLSDAQLNEYKLLVESISPEDVKPFPGVEDVLKGANKNVIMTHKHRKSLLEMLAYHGWEKYFSEVVAGDDGFPRKPDKASYEYLHRKHSLDLAVGDRELDIIPAKQLGMATCLFQNDASELADFYLDDYRDFWDKVII